MWMPCTVLCRTGDRAQPLRSMVPHSVPAQSAANEVKPMVAATRCTLSCAVRIGAGLSLTWVRAGAARDPALTRRAAPGSGRPRGSVGQ